MRGSALCDPGLGYSLCRQRPPGLLCRGPGVSAGLGGGHRPPPATIRRAGPGPQHPTLRCGAACTEAGGAVAGGGECLWGPGRWPWPSGCQREPGPAHSPGVHSKEGCRGLRPFCLRSSPPQGPGHQPQGLGPPGRGWGKGATGPGRLPFDQIPGRLELTQPWGPGWLHRRSPHKQTHSSPGAGSWVCGERGSCAWLAGTRAPVGADERSGSWPLARRTTSTASRDAAPRLSPRPGPAPLERPPGAGRGGPPLSAVPVDEEDVLVRAVAGPGLLEVADAGAAHSCCGRRAGRSAGGTLAGPHHAGRPLCSRCGPCEPVPCAFPDSAGEREAQRGGTRWRPQGCLWSLPVPGAVGSPARGGGQGQGRADFLFSFGHSAQCVGS